MHRCSALLASALLASLLLGVVGCGAVSREEYDRLSATVAERNERARDRAEAELLERLGLTRIDPSEELWVRLSDEDTRRCLRLRQGSRAQADEQEADAPTTLAVRAGGSDTEVSVTAPLSEACAFFERPAQVDVTMPDGATRRLVRWSGGRLARDARGELVEYSLDARVVDRWHVTVEMSCDHMPRPYLGPFEMGPANARGLWERPTRRESVAYESVELDHRCTENTY